MRFSKCFKLVPVLSLVLLLGACSSKTVHKQGFQLPPALTETLRGGALKGLEDASGASLGMPTQYDLVGHVCTSEPIFDVYGRFVKTDVRCW